MKGIPSSTATVGLSAREVSRTRDVTSRDPMLKRFLDLLFEDDSCLDWGDDPLFLSRSKSASATSGQPPGTLQLSPLRRNSSSRVD